jgi:elongation factor G
MNFFTKKNFEKLSQKIVQNTVSTRLHKFTYKSSSNSSQIKIKSTSSSENIPIQSFPTELIRNIGIIAHIDAGKTTTTERMLFYSGVIGLPGEVHYGNTVMDYMEQERKRGITIRAAAISFEWKNHQINLIDTPGHIDFTGEVERSVRVLDAAVLILDASQGVETQTMTVWKQADRYFLPRFAYINKVDKIGASIENTLYDIQKKLGVRPILFNYPDGEENLFTSLIDLVNFQKINFLDSLGVDIQYSDITKDDSKYAKYSKLRDILVEEVASLDEEIMDFYLENKPVPIENLKSSLRKLIISNKIIPVFCGSSLKNKGVQSILDGVVDYFPSPYDLKPIKAEKSLSKEKVEKHASNKGNLCGFIFKIINDKEKGPISFFKIYEGVLRSKSNIKFINSGVSERIVQLLRVKANECIQLNEISAGDIGAITGLKNVKAGSTFTLASVDPSEEVVLPGFYMPPPVFFCNIYPKRNADFKPLMNILSQLEMEDPSFSVKYDQETNQYLLSGLGELHLEVIRDRIELEYGINSVLGKMKVSFRESIRASNRFKHKTEKLFNGNRIYLELDILVYPVENNLDLESVGDLDKILYEKEMENSNNLQTIEEIDEDKFIFPLNPFTESGYSLKIDKNDKLKLHVTKAQSEVTFSFEKMNNFTDIVKHENGEEEVFRSINQLPSQMKMQMLSSVLESLNSGSLLGYPMLNIGIDIKGGRFSEKRTNDIAVKVCVHETIKSVTSQAEPWFLEPFMIIEITAPNYASSEIISDMSKRRGKIAYIQNANEIKYNHEIKFIYDFMMERKSSQNYKDSNDLITKIYAFAPLSELIGYAAFIRSISQGEAKHYMVFYNYDFVGSTLQNKILDGSYFYE